MKKSISLLVASLVFLLTTACKKEEDRQPKPTVSKKELISKTWKVDQVVINDVRDQTKDYSSVRFQFKPDGTYRVTTEVGGTAGTWELSSNEQKIRLDKGTDEEGEITVLLLNESRLDLETVEHNPKTGTKKTVYKLRQ